MSYKFHVDFIVWMTIYWIWYGEEIVIDVNFFLGMNIDLGI